MSNLKPLQSSIIRSKNITKYPLNFLMNPSHYRVRIVPWSFVKRVSYSEIGTFLVCFDLSYLWVNPSPSLFKRKRVIKVQWFHFIPIEVILFSFQVLTYPTRNREHTPTKKKKKKKYIYIYIYQLHFPYIWAS
jgi:hypothetical protein